MTLTQARGDMSMKELADKVGVSYQMIYYIEKGVKRPSPETAEKISDVLDISLEDMWDMFYSSKESEVTDDDASASHA